MINNLQKARLRQNGYIKIDSCVDRSVLLDAQRAFNRWRHELLTGKRTLTRFENIGVCHYCHAFHDAAFMQVLHGLAFECAEALLGVGNAVEFGRALMGWPPAFEHCNRRQAWHVDTVDIALASEYPRHFPRFQLVIGFPLTAITGDNEGGLIVWPGQHEYIADIFRHFDDKKAALEKIQEDMYNSYPPGEVKYLYEQPGDMVLFNSLLPHGTAINLSPYFADKVYFRFCHADPQVRAGQLACVRPWSNWQGMKAAMS